MKRNAVHVGEEYLLKQSGQQVRVRIESVRSSGGWDAVNIATGLTVRVKHPNNLAPIPEGPAEPREIATVEGTPVVEPTVTGAEPIATQESMPKRLSALDAAAVVLNSAAEPMTAKQLIEAMTAQELWTSPGGKTPDATLASALVREITKKGSASRFAKPAPGRFAARRD